MGAFAALLVSCSPNRQKEGLPENPQEGQVYQDGSSHWVWNSAMQYWMIRSLFNAGGPVHYYYPSSREWSQGVQGANGGFQPSAARSTTPPSTVPPATVRSSYKSNSTAGKSGSGSSSGMRKGGFGGSRSTPAS